MNITFPTDTRELIDAIRTVIGRPVYFVTNTPIPCSGCSLDPVTNTSTNPYCLVCSGVYYIPNYTTVTISGHVTWAPSETLGWVSGGQLIDGDCRVQISYTDEHLATLELTDYAIIDSKRFLVNSKMFRGVPELNRILIDFKREE